MLKTDIDLSKLTRLIDTRYFIIPKLK